MSNKVGYYPDGVTKYTDPFYRCVCRKCIEIFWGVTINSKCPICKTSDVFRSFNADETEAEAKALKKRIS
jgi:hypothetical protein